MSSLVDASPLGLVDTYYLGLLVVATSIAVASGLAVIGSVYAGHAASAWIGAALFVASSLVAAWTFGRLT